MKSNTAYRLWSGKQGASLPAARFPGFKYPVTGAAAGIVGLDGNTLLQTILRNESTGIIICNSRGKITLVNAAAKRLAQMNPEGRAISTAPNIFGELFDSSGQRVPATEWPCLRALQGHTIIGRECRLIRENGRWREVLFSACPIRSGDSQTLGAFSSLANITKQRRRELASREEVVLKERDRIAADIHDTVVQGLNAILLQLEAEQELIENSEQTRQRLCRTCELTRQTLAEARRSVWALGQETFENEDLVTALAFLAEKLFDPSSIELQLSLGNQRRQMRPGVRLGLLQISREAMTNILKHAAATKVRISLRYNAKYVRVSIEDNGRGFVSLPFAKNQAGFGLFCLQRRAEHCGGWVTVNSWPGKGTRVVATAPLLQDPTPHCN